MKNWIYMHVIIYDFLFRNSQVLCYKKLSENFFWHIVGIFETEIKNIYLL